MVSQFEFSKAAMPLSPPLKQVIRALTTDSTENAHSSSSGLVPECGSARYQDSRPERVPILRRFHSEAACRLFRSCRLLLLWPALLGRFRGLGLLGAACGYGARALPKIPRGKLAQARKIRSVSIIAPTIKNKASYQPIRSITLNFKVVFPDGDE